MSSRSFAPRAFYLDAHQKIFQGIVALYDKGHPADLVTLAEHLKENKHIEDVGGYSYLAELWDAAPTAANAEYYARIIRDKAIVRNLIHASNEILRDSYDQAQPAEELLDGAERRILDIAQMGVMGQTIELEKAIAEAYDRIDRRSQRDAKSISGLSTGYVDLDSMTAGLQNSELVIIAARPSIGKTSFALNLARHIALEEKQPVFFVSLEQSRIELAERLLCCQARVDSHKLRTGHLSSEDMKILVAAGGQLSGRQGVHRRHAGPGTAAHCRQWPTPQAAPQDQGHHDRLSPADRAGQPPRQSARTGGDDFAAP